MAQAKRRSSPASSRVRKARRSLPRQRSQKLTPQPQYMARKRILDQLQDAIDRCDDLFNEHGEACACEACCITSNLVGTVRVFKMLLEIS